LIKFFTNELQSNNFFQKKAKETEVNLRADFNKYKSEHDQFLKFKDEIFNGKNDKKYNEIYKMLKDFDPTKKNPFDIEKDHE
jgi:predicted nuclease of restriction endonuclease-like RecB superfamily